MLHPSSKFSKGRIVTGGGALCPNVGMFDGKGPFDFGLRFYINAVGQIGQRRAHTQTKFSIEVPGKRSLPRCKRVSTPLPKFS